MPRFIISLTVLFALLQGSLTQAQDNDLRNSTALVDNRPYTGDLEGMVERRIIRVLTVYGPGRYYLDNGAKGITAEYANRLEKVINDSFETGHLKVAVFVLPVARDELFLALEQGRGDVIMAGTTVTPAREQQAAFTIPSSKPLKEILVAGPSAPALNSIDDLSGKSVYLRASSSYAESVAKLNQRFANEGRAPVTIEPMSELLEDEDLIEMVDAGLLPWTIVDDYKPTQWSGVFTNLHIRNDIV